MESGPSRYWEFGFREGTAGAWARARVIPAAPAMRRPRVYLSAFRITAPVTRLVWTGRLIARQQGYAAGGGRLDCCQRQVRGDSLAHLGTPLRSTGVSASNSGLASGRS